MTMNPELTALVADLRFHHLGVAVKSIAEALPVYKALFGYALEAGPVTDPIQKVTVCFLRSDRANDLVIELVEPAAEKSAVNTVLAKGIGAYHTCYEVADVARALAAFRSGGCVVVSNPVPAAAFNNRPIAWFYTPTRQLIELVQREGA